MKNIKSYRNPAIVWLTILIAILSLTASLSGLLISDLYRDHEVIKMGWHANDLVTILTIPVLLLALFLQRRGDERPLLVWIGLMLYMFFNYAYYIFGVKFNELFPIYFILFSLSFYSIIIGLLAINIHAIEENSVFHKNKIVIGLFLFLLVIPLALIEIKQCITFITSGNAPGASMLISALDISTVIPAVIFTAILLWKNNPWGNVLGMMMLIKTFLYGVVLLAGALFMSTSGITPPDKLIPFYILLVVGGLIFGLILLRDLKPSGLMQK